MSPPCCSSIPGRPAHESGKRTARSRIQSALPPTPLVRNQALDKSLGCAAWIKLENTTAVGAFKIRGGMNLIMSLSAAERRQGICAPTRGNHGQSLAYARESGARFVHPGKEPKLIAGVGSCIAGIALALRGTATRTRLIGVQSASAPAMYRAWQAGSQQAVAAIPSLADGLAVSESVAETLELMRGQVHDMLLVTEQELAGAMQIRSLIAGKRIAIVLSGGNVDRQQLADLFAAEIA